MSFAFHILVLELSANLVPQVSSEHFLTVLDINALLSIAISCYSFIGTFQLFEFQSSHSVRCTPTSLPCAKPDLMHVHV